VIHVRRPDGQSVDAILHANPRGGEHAERGVLFAFNPTDRPIAGNLSLPLYYTGLTDVAWVTHEEDSAGASPSGAAAFRLERGYTIRLPVRIAANGYSWWVIR
jgi:hypothetical protein